MWIDVTDALNDLVEGGMQRVLIEGLFAQVDGAFFAFDDVCPHMHESLSEGDLDGYYVYCPMHYSGFDIRTGQVCNLPARRSLTVYPIRIDADTVWVKLPDTTALNRGMDNV